MTTRCPDHPPLIAPGAHLRTALLVLLVVGVAVGFGVLAVVSL